jgi:peroxiredoxin
MPTQIAERPLSKGPRHRLAVGDAAPDSTVGDAAGRGVSLAELWSRGPIVLTFLRHFG